MAPEIPRSIRLPCSNAASGLSQLKYMLMTAQKRDGDCDESGPDKPQRDDRPKNLAPPTGGIEGEALGVQHDTLLRPFSDQCRRIFDKPGQPVDRFDQAFDPLTQPRLGAAIILHPAFDQ